GQSGGAPLTGPGSRYTSPVTTPAQVAELVDALVSGTSAARRGGSSPLLGTTGPPASRVMRRPLSLQGPAHRCLCRNNLAENTRFVAKPHRGTSRKRQVPESPSVMVLYTCKWWSLLRILRKVFPGYSICFRTDPQSSRVSDWGQVRESRAGW